MKVRQLRKRKPVPPMAWMQGHIRRELRRRLCRLVRVTAVRNDTAGRGAVEGVIERSCREYIEDHGLPPYLRWSSEVTP